ncbi:hypothetical protein LJR030_000070 [Rhizobium sp. LjRoot30]|uniref:hypothetical protein n=1 Tax=Rhizobium sp. LjRoot30 TaxID=3342320 RepID=UPI003ECFFFDB
MRKFIVAATMSVFFITGFTPMADASPINTAGSHRGLGIGSDVVPVDHYYGHRRKYKRKNYYQEEHCWWKKVRRYDEYGDVYYERIRICK